MLKKQIENINGKKIEIVDMRHDESLEYKVFNAEDKHIFSITIKNYGERKFDFGFYFKKYLYGEELPDFVRYLYYSPREWLKYPKYWFTLLKVWFKHPKEGVNDDTDFEVKVNKKSAFVSRKDWHKLTKSILKYVKDDIVPEMMGETRYFYLHRIPKSCQILPRNKYK